MTENNDADQTKPATPATPEEAGEPAATPVVAEGQPNAAEQRDATAATIEPVPAPGSRNNERLAAPDVDYVNHPELPVAARRLAGPNPTVIDPADVRDGETVQGVADASGKQTNTDTANTGKTTKLNTRRG